MVWGGYFFVLQMLRPNAKPNVKQVIHKLITAIKPSIVNISTHLLSIPCFCRFQSEGHNALRKGELTVRHLKENKCFPSTIPYNHYSKNRPGKQVKIEHMFYSDNSTFFLFFQEKSLTNREKKRKMIKFS